MGRDLAQRVQQNAEAVAPGAGPKAPTSIGQLIQSLRPEMARALPKHMDADRMARIALTVLRTNPNLGQSTPESFMGSLLTCAQLGLEPGAGGEAYLVPYTHRRGPLAGRTECQLIIGYQGYAKLFWQHPMAKHIDAQAVYERDEFDYAYGLEPFLVHKPAIGDRGEVIAFYAVAALTSGGKGFVVLSPEQVKDLRGGKVGPSGQIADPMLWMERKTVLRQLVKLLPKSTNLVRALEADEKVRTDLQEEAIDAPMRDLPAGAAVALVQTDQSADEPPADTTVDTSPTEEPATDGEADVEKMTQGQSRAMHGLFRDLGMADDHAKQLRGIANAIGREIGSKTDLTKDEAAFIIDSLKARKAQHVAEPVPADDVVWPPVAEPGSAS